MRPSVEQHALRRRCELELRQPDAVMEPGVLEVITRYIKASGQPSDAVTFLTEHYVGARRLPVTLAAALRRCRCEDFRRR